MSEYKASKFGGTSMAHPEVVAGIVDEDPERQFIVASAPGKLGPGDTKVTDLLFRHANGADLAARDAVLDRFTTIFDGLKPNKVTELQNELLRDLKDEHVSVARTVSRGEYYSAKALAERLGIQFIDAAELFKFSSNRFNRAATDILIRRHLGHLSLGQKVVIPGYYGQDEFGNIQVFDRGGSDRTGAILASTLGMTYENWTDTDGIFSADPKIVPDAQVIPVLSREEVREGAHGGAGVLQGDTIIDLNGSDTTVIVRNTFNPKASGTRVVKQRLVQDDASVVAFSGRDDLTEITVKDMGMANTPGYVARLLDYFSGLGLSVEHMPQAQDAFSVTTASRIEDEEKIQKFVEYARQNLITKTASVEVSPKGVVYAVGEGLRDPAKRTRAQIRLLGELSVQNLAVEDVVSNRTSPSLAFLVKPEDVEPIVKALHKREFGSKTPLINR